ncbi:hypothetical protein P168DRAFT_91971 [Aspergillus campestris IBT 28561]|uniref:Uncharacterized protein n=1 Tax=Aspergillus campestris (strain IBT 28561) TaxID=1392248 RepID=A0A2I1DBK4_ASPC2|nr:uncharacterized protein P168DRAFT_91971 [Aspergillus campestris IBT 28561]PKY07258.1 hypothetical protein P168DRAFT_91971 [Aspergillus campestris IBT 28561]
MIWILDYMTDVRSDRRCLIWIPEACPKLGVYFPFSIFVFFVFLLLLYLLLCLFLSFSILFRSFLGTHRFASFEVQSGCNRHVLSLLHSLYTVQPRGYSSALISDQTAFLSMGHLTTTNTH